MSASNPVSGEARREALDDVRAVAPGLLDANPWPERYSGLAREQGALAGIFGT